MSENSMSDNVLTKEYIVFNRFGYRAMPTSNSFFGFVMY
tara:strand:- start:140 stop:256 length:117 start_codon:yes stop_codon:yes gene_type:complete